MSNNKNPWLRLGINNHNYLNNTQEETPESITQINKGIKVYKIPTQFTIISC